VAIVKITHDLGRQWAEIFAKKDDLVVTSAQNYTPLEGMIKFLEKLDANLPADKRH
jgi:hypothetical protein